MPNPKSRYEPTHTLASLQSSMRGIETRLRKVIAISARDDGEDGKSTIAEHDRRTKRDKTLILVAVPDGQMPQGPDGATFDFEGEGWIENVKTRLAVYR